MRSVFAGACATVTIIFATSCGGSSGTPAGPSASPGASTGAPAIMILGERGAQSFAPNPASARQGDTVTWRNSDSVTHRIVFNDETLDTGDILPGATSRALQLRTDGARYHCSLHPGMVGSINASSGAPPPCEGLYC